MTRLPKDPKVVKLARDLGLPITGDCLSRITAFALARVQQLTEGFDVGDVSMLRRVLANRLRMRIEFIKSDADVGRLADSYEGFQPLLRERLIAEFVNDSTEGLTLERDGEDPRWCQFLAIIDARGVRSNRAYFTAWHEVVHLLIHPPQLAFPGFRRSPAVALIEKDPIESVVDSIAGHVAFYEPLFRPVLDSEVAREGSLTFAAIDRARSSAVPEASFFAAALASVRLSRHATLLVSVEVRHKRGEIRRLSSGQLGFGFAAATVQPQLRVATVARSDTGSDAGFAIFANMRVPANSILAKAFASDHDVTLIADEDQSWWETSEEGALAALPIRVEALRRGSYVYGLLSVTRRPPTQRR